MYVKDRKHQARQTNRVLKFASEARDENVPAKRADFFKSKNCKLWSITQSKAEHIFCKNRGLEIVALGKQTQPDAFSAFSGQTETELCVHYSSTQVSAEDQAMVSYLWPGISSYHLFLPIHPNKIILLYFPPTYSKHHSFAYQPVGCQRSRNGTDKSYHSLH